LDCSSNNLSSLNVSNNTKLTKLYCFYNVIADLNLNNNTALTYLSCYKNKITILDIKKNTVLKTLICGDNQLTALDVSKNTLLTTLRCTSNQLTAIDVNNNTALTILDCGYNQIMSINITKIKLLNTLFCTSNKLINLNLKNGENSKLTSLNTTNNPLLKCILIDDPNKIGGSWNKDFDTQYSTNCIVSTEDSEVVPSLTLYPNPATKTLQIRWESDLESVQVVLLNSFGAIITTQHLGNQASINIENLPRGLYFCRIRDDNQKTQTTKVILE
jgi:hypothetical protein